MIKAILFDMDGVLVDSEDVSISIAISYFKTLGFEAQPSDWKGCLGCGEEVFFNKPAEKLGIKFDYDDARRYMAERYPVEIRKSSHAAMPGAVAAVKSAHCANMLAAVVSSAPEWKVLANLDAIGLSKNDFDLIIHGGMVKRNKPEADIYRLAQISFGLGPEECLVVEDTVFGVKAGVAAGMQTLGLTTSGYGIPEFYEAGANYVLGDLSCLKAFNSCQDLDESLEKGLMVPDYRLIDFAKTAMTHAYAPYSGFKVGAAVLTKSGEIYQGCNIENSSYGATICAERCAICHAVIMEGPEMKISAIAIHSEADPPAPPCGMCLQVLSEFSTSGTKVILSGKNGGYEYLLSELLPTPFSFTPKR